MKRLTILLAILLGLCGCSKETSNKDVITYNLNAGPDITELEYSNIVFNIYHTVEGKWTLLHTFSDCPKQGVYVDVDLTIREENPEELVFTLQETTVSEENDTIIYDHQDVDSYTYTVAGNTESYGISYRGELKKNNDEQIYQIYPIGGNVIANMEEYKSMNDPYLEEGDNLDNILVTFTLEV